MSVIQFPGINLILNISKIAFKIGNIEIYNYAICIVLGIILAIILCRLNKNKYEIKFDFLLEATLYCLIFGIIGARIYYVIFNIENYSKNLIQLFNLRNGGLAIYGGLISGLISLIIICKIKKQNILDLLDYIVPAVVLAQSIGRWGNFFNIEAYGTPTTNFFRMGINISNNYIEVHPTFLYESFFCLIITFLLLLFQKNRKFKGQIVLTYLMMYSFVRFFIEKLRIDSLMLFNFRVNCIFSAIIFVFSFGIYLKKFLYCRKISKNSKN